MSPFVVLPHHTYQSPWGQGRQRWASGTRESQSNGQHTPSMPANTVKTRSGGCQVGSRVKLEWLGAACATFIRAMGRMHCSWCGVDGQGMQPLLLLLSVPKAFKSMILYQMWLFILGMGHMAMGGVRSGSICRVTSPRIPTTLGPGVLEMGGGDGDMEAMGGRLH